MLEHNRVTLQQINAFVARGQDCCVVNPCGSGKSSVMAGFIKSHKDKKMIIFTKQKNAEIYYHGLDPAFSGVPVRTYMKMLSDYKKGDVSVYDADYYLADEAHYIGADKWGEAFDELRKRFSPVVIGFTATPQRFRDQGTDGTVVSEYFSGNSAGNYTTKQLQKDGVFTEPEYVLSLWDLSQDVEERLMKIAESDLSEEQKKRYSDRLNAILKEWETKSNPESVLRSTLPRFMYKEHNNRILVYCASVRDAEEKMPVVDSMIRRVFPGKKIKSFRYTHLDNENILKEFQAEDRQYIKVLYSVDKIMETVHMDDLNILIALRPSVSNRIITQQFGRLNSIGNDKKPLIIDMVDNLSHLNTISFLGGVKSKGTKEHSGIRLMHISPYHSLFTEVDAVFMRSRPYTYRGFTGSLSQIARVFGKQYQDLKHLVWGLGEDLEDAMEKARPVNMNVSAEVFSGSHEVRDFGLTEDQKVLARENMSMVDSFIKRKGITDDDIKQELFMEYLYKISQYDKERHGYLNTFVMNSLIARYVRVSRNMVIRERVYADGSFEKEAERDSYADPFEFVAHKDLKKELKRALKLLTDRERGVLECRFGLNGEDAMTLEETGKVFGVQRERIRQIEAKALRKLRHPVRSWYLKDYVYQ